MKIEVTRTFMHGRDRFEAKDVRTVSDSDGAYFIKNGWASEVGKPAPQVSVPGSVDLGVQSSKLGHKERKHG